MLVAAWHSNAGRETAALQQHSWILHSKLHYPSSYLHVDYYSCFEVLSLKKQLFAYERKDFTLYYP